MDESVLRASLVDLLRGASAHLAFADAVEGLPAELRARRPPGGGHSVWELIEHMRIAQQDLLRYTLEAGWRSPDWPDGYWPPPADEVADAAWEASLAAFAADIEALIALVQDGAVDLTTPIPHARQHTPLREVLIAADHNAYHLGQVVAVRRALGAWSR